MKEKILLIAGGSDPAGSEIDGTQDSKYNRSKSFAARLADDGRVFSDYKIISVAVCGVSNSSILRTILMWFKENYDPETMDVFVIIGWADSARMESPFHRPTHYDEMNPALDWYDKNNSDYLIVNAGWQPPHEDEQKVTNLFVNFMAQNLEYLELQSMNYILELQWFFKSLDVKYLMVNTLHMFSDDNRFLEPYFDLIDEIRYFNFKDSQEAFYIKYEKLGYSNPKAKYAHHSEEVHLMYSHLLEDHILTNKLHEHTDSR